MRGGVKKTSLKKTWEENIKSREHLIHSRKEKKKKTALQLRKQERGNKGKKEAQNSLGGAFPQFGPGGDCLGEKKGGLQRKKNPGGPGKHISVAKKASVTQVEKSGMRQGKGGGGTKTHKNMTKKTLGGGGGQYKGGVSKGGKKHGRRKDLSPSKGDLFSRDVDEKKSEPKGRRAPSAPPGFGKGPEMGGREGESSTFKGEAVERENSPKKSGWEAAYPIFWHRQN